MFSCEEEVVGVVLEVVDLLDSMVVVEVVDLLDLMVVVGVVEERVKKVALPTHKKEGQEKGEAISHLLPLLLLLVDD